VQGLGVLGIHLQDLPTDLLRGGVLAGLMVLLGLSQGFSHRRHPLTFVWYRLFSLAGPGFRPLKVVRMDRESSSVVSLLLEPVDGRPLTVP
jgi:hypothetical protein